ncbi:MAG: aminotransferase class I/II-fold pyridoxal phosphate-dependent enzyme [Promethearchaeota archaeon]|nr:MAG: aminotransferase class I/II-fold pyridoxal phosphate-dependent enzyme [Candidatus Lokiarchaeota archaeon]
MNDKGNKENKEDIKYKFATRCIHGPKKYAPDVYGPTNPVTSPIYMTSAFNVKQALDGVLPNYIYTRGSNPTINELQSKLADLENGESCLAFASGMAAISNTLLSLGKKGTIITDPEVYGGTHDLLKKQIVNFGMKIKFIDFNDIEKVQNSITDDTKVLYLESPCNPTMKFIDIEEIVRIGKENDILTVFDNTLNSPYNLNPLDYGIDVVVHSCTKFISGHGDTVAGAVITKKRTILKIMKVLHEFGGIISPFNAWLLLRGLRSLHVRMERHNTNAIKLATFLESRDDKIEKVLYPGLENSPYHNIAKKYLKKGFGGVLSFYLKKGLYIPKFLSTLKIPAYTVSLGDTDTLIEDPYNLSHFGMPRKTKKTIGINFYMIRVSVGIEDIEDLIDDFEQALDSI